MKKSTLVALSLAMALSSANSFAQEAPMRAKAMMATERPATFAPQSSRTVVISDVSPEESKCMHVVIPDLDLVAPSDGGTEKKSCVTTKAPGTDDKGNTGTNVCTECTYTSNGHMTVNCILQPTR